MDYFCGFSVPQQEKNAFHKAQLNKKTITSAPLFTKPSDTVMKIKFLLAALAICAFVSVPAQAQDEDTRHEVAVSYGCIPNSIWIDAYTDIIPAMFGEKHETKRRIGPVGLEYYYHTSSLIGVGAVAVFATSNQDCLYNDTKTSDITKSFFTVMPSIKFNWLRKRHWGLYSKVAAGATYARFNDTSNCVIAVNNTGGWTDFRLFVRDVGAKDGEIYYRRIQTTQDCHTTDLEKTGKVSEGYLSFDLAPFSSIVLSNVPGESLSEDTEVFPVQREAEPVHTQPPAEAVPAEQPNKTVPEESRPEIPAAPTQPSVETAPAVQPSESAPQEDSRETPAAAADAEQI